MAEAEAGPPPGSSAARRIAGGVALIPALAFAGLALAARVDAPALDDFDAVLGFLLKQRGAEGLEWLAGFVEPHVDHRILWTRLLLWTQWAVVGRADFAVLSLVGAGLMAGIFALLVWGRASHATRVGAFGWVAASLLWFQPQAYDLLSWPTASLANYSVFFFAAAALGCVRYGTSRALAGAWLCCAAATLCLGNGSLAWPSVVLALLWTKRVRQAAGFALASLPPLGLYAATYRGHSEGAAHLLDPGRLVEVVVHAFQLLGAVAGPLGATPAAWLGALVAVACVALGVVGRQRLDVRVLGMGLFVLGTVAGNAVLRAGLGAEYALSQPRYRLSSILVLLLVALGTLDWIRGRRHERAVVGALCVAALGFSVVSYASNGPRVLERSESLARGVARWQLTGEGLSHSEPLRAGTLLRRARKAGVYRPRPEALARWLDDASGRSVPPAPSDALRARIGRIATDADFALVERRVALDGAEPGPVFIVLEGEGVDPIAISARSRVFDDEESAAGLAFRSVFPRSAAEARDAVGVLVATPEGDAWIRTGQGLSASPGPRR